MALSPNKMSTRQNRLPFGLVHIQGSSYASRVDSVPDFFTYKSSLIPLLACEQLSNVAGSSLFMLSQ